MTNSARIRKTLEKLEFLVVLPTGLVVIPELPHTGRIESPYANAAEVVAAALAALALN